MKQKKNSELLPLQEIKANINEIEKELIDLVNQAKGKELPFGQMLRLTAMKLQIILMRFQYAELVKTQIKSNGPQRN